MTLGRVEKARSDRSKCKKCKDYIKKNSIRASFIQFMGDWDQYAWYHFRCFITYKSILSHDNLDTWPGFDELSEAQRKQLTSQFLNAKKRQKEHQEVQEEQKDDHKIQFQEKQDETTQTQNQDEDKIKGKMEECELKSVVGNDNKSQNSQKLDMIDENPDQTQGQLQQGDSDEIERDYDSEYLGYTKEEANKFQLIVGELKSMKLNDMKQELKERNMLQTGTANEVTRRLADCRLLGIIPLCPKCNHGRMSFKVKSGVYNCPGYHNGVCYLKCDETFKREHIRRLPWNSS